MDDPKVWAIGVLDELRARIVASDVELVIHMAPRLEQLQRIARWPGIGPADDADVPE